MVIPGVLCLVTYTHHLEILNRCNGYEESIFYMLYTAHQHLKVEELRRSMSPTTVAEYKRVLIPREVMKKSLADYCEFLKKEYNK